MFNVVNGRLHQNGVPVEFHPSPNFNSGRRIAPRAIVIHDTAGHGHGNDTVAHFMVRSAEASAHIMVREDGTPVQFVELDRRAWHAGLSEWGGSRDVNSWAIGIEMCNPGKLWGSAEAAYPEHFRTKFTEAEHGIVQIDTKAHGRAGGWWKPYTPAQIATLAAIVEALAEAIPEIDEILGHTQISPGRKIDPNPIMYDRHWPQLEAALRSRLAIPPPVQEMSHTSDEIHQVQARLNDLGFGPVLVDGISGGKTGGALWAFQQGNGLNTTGRLDPLTFMQLRDGSAKPAAIAGRQASTPKDLTKTDPIAQGGAMQKSLGQLQLLLSAVVTVLTMVSDLGAVIAKASVSVGGDSIILIGCSVLCGFGLMNWRAGVVSIQRAWSDWVSGKSGATVPPPVSNQEG